MGLGWIELRLILTVALCVVSAMALPLLLVRSRRKRSLTWMVCWGALALIGPAAAWSLAGDDDENGAPALSDSDFPSLLKGVPESIREDVPDSTAVTDKGSPLRLQTAARVHFNPEEFQRMQSELLERVGMLDTVTPLPLGWVNANCHGWVFTGGTHFVVNEEVQTILDDNGYQTVGSPRAGDVAVYRNSRGDIIHTGLVRSIDQNKVLVESKWGHCGVFLHPSDVHPYELAECTFYRCNRADHIVKGLPDVPLVRCY